MSVIAPRRQAVPGGGAAARRAMIRWAVRLFRREWRQQLFVVAMLAVAVAAMVVGTAVAANTRGETGQATFGTGNAIVSLPGTDPHLAADIAPAPLSATQVSDARIAVTAAGGQIETKSGELSLTQIGDGATATGLLIALATLAMSVGIVRSETSGDLRTLAATGASARTRRAITAATAAGLGLLGSAGGAAMACLAVLAWARGSLGAVFTHVPGLDYLLILVGLPLAAAAGGWLLAGREQPVISRQPID